MTINNNQNQIILDPLKQIILDDEVVDMVLKEVMQDPVYMENFLMYDSGKMKKEEFIDIVNRLVLEYKEKVTVDDSTHSPQIQP